MPAPSPEDVRFAFFTGVVIGLFIGAALLARFRRRKPRSYGHPSTFFSSQRFR